jgi:quercetin dioxygenase-like cupin family protein
MNTPGYIYLQNVKAESAVPENGILSRTLQNDERTKVILFSFAPGQELSAHTAPFPATLYFVHGSATVKLGADTKPAAEGTFVYMEPFLEHGIKAETEVVMLLTMFKGARQG